MTGASSMFLPTLAYAAGTITSARQTIVRVPLEGQNEKRVQAWILQRLEAIQNDIGWLQACEDRRRSGMPVDEIADGFGAVGSEE